MTQSIVKKKIAIWQPYFMGGGAEAVALWILAALVENYDVTLCTFSKVELERLNTMYGTNLSLQALKVRALLPSSLTQLAYGLIANNAFIKLLFTHLSIRRFKAISDQYDLVFSAYNAVDLGRPGLQYLHWVHVVERPWDKANLLMKIVLMISQFSPDRLKSNASLANSSYTAQRVKDSYGIESQVVYPPVTTEIEPLSWEEKEDTFLCSGRVVLPKQTHRVIRILEVVRSKGFDVKLHITGGGGGTYGFGYQSKIRKLAEANSEWIQFHQNLPYRDYLKIVARCRYGIHYKPEPFGISVAEMLKANMIPFVRSKGGQMEIVGSGNDDILFHNEEDGIKKIIAVLSNQARQREILASLENQNKLFSTDRFMEEIRQAVDACLESAT
jgi:glycosyltransferase involved in cell wall biosynthesis